MQRGAGGSRPRRLALLTLRALRTGGLALEALGRARVELHDLDAAVARRRRAARLHVACAEAVALHGIELRCEGRWPTGPAILVANHLSYIDSLALAGAVPCMPIAKQEVADWPLIGSAAKAMGIAFVRRGDAWSGARVLRAGLRALASGVSVLGFPEGTTSDGRQVLPFHRGLFGLARLTGVPVVPVALRYDDPELCWVGGDWFLPHYLRTAMREHTRGSVRIGRAIDPRGFDSAEALSAHVHARLAALLGVDADPNGQTNDAHSTAAATNGAAAASATSSAAPSAATAATAMPRGPHNGQTNGAAPVAGPHAAAPAAPLASHGLAHNGQTIASGAAARRRDGRSAAPAAFDHGQTSAAARVARR